MKKKVNEIEVKNGKCYMDIISKDEVHTFVFDAEDLEKVDEFAWSVQKNCKTYYAVTYVDKKMICLHRFLMQAEEGYVVDHIDNNGYNNCKSNLRICTVRENLYNTGAAQNKVVPYKNVYKVNDKSTKYKVVIQGKVLKSQLTLEEAVEFANLKRKEIFGEFAWVDTYKKEKVA